MKQETGNFGSETVFSLSLNDDSKVRFGAKTGSTYPLLWVSGDRIRVNGVMSDALPSAKAGTSSAQFTVSGVSSPYTILHPARAYVSDGKVKFASSQNHEAGSCPLATTVLSCRTDDKENVVLDNLCGYLRLRINRSSDTTRFSRIEFYGNNGEDVAGVFSLSYDSDGHPVLGNATEGQKTITLSSIIETGEYIITIPAMTFSKGFTVDVVDVSDHYMRISTDASVRISTAVLLNTPAVDYVPNGIVREPVVHTVDQMNTDVVKDSHAGEELSASLQPMYKYSQIIPNATLEPELYSKTGYTDQKFACYPRIKQLSDGSFIMFYHGGQLGSRIWCTTSSDYLSWNTPKLLFEPIKLTTPASVKGDYRVFVNPDAVVLDNGDILLVASYRAKSHYSQGLDCGLAFRRSTDNGKSWSQAVYLPVGPNWEPYILKLEDGTLQCYYTDAIPQTRNSGTGLVISNDGGNSWGAKIRPCQRYKYLYKTADTDKSAYNGQVIYTDQMPCFRQLNDGSLVGWLENRLENPTPSDCADDAKYNSYYTMSMVYNSGTSWTDLTNYSSKNEGPTDRSQKVNPGAGGYIATFKSGEVLFSWSAGSAATINIANNTARSFKSADWKTNVYKPLSYKGFWPTIEACYGNCVAVAMHSRADKLSEEFVESEYPGMQLAMMYLNHRIDADKEAIKLDGFSDDWTTGQALYVSAPSKEEAILRASRGDSNLYLVVEMEDDTQKAATYVHVKLGKDSSKKVDITFNCNGVYSPGTTQGVSLVVQKGKTAAGKNGFVCEICVPLSILGASSGDRIQCYMDLKVNNVLYPFAESTSSNLSTWKIIKLLPDVRKTDVGFERE